MKSSAGIIGMGLMGTVPSIGSLMTPKTQSNKKLIMDALQTDILVVGAGPSGIPAAIQPPGRVPE